MKTYIALFRGINVGGSHLLPMKELRLLLEENGCLDVRTYIQSGNAIFRCAMSHADWMADQLSAAVSRRCGFEPRVVVLTCRDLERTVADNPFLEAEDDPRTVHVFFLAEPPKSPDLEALEALKARGERFVLKGKLLYLHTPDGFGTSRLAARAERLLGVEATARNWRTVTALLEMARRTA